MSAFQFDSNDSPFPAGPFNAFGPHSSTHLPIQVPNLAAIMNRPAPPPDNTPVLPPNGEFLLESPLYVRYKATDTSASRLEKLLYREVHIDSFCIECGKERGFWTEPSGEALDVGVSSVASKHRMATVTFACSTNKLHKLHFAFKLGGGKVEKIGQWPAIADLEGEETKCYQKVLGKERFSEYKRAIGLATHGVGIGAFVYLRRIFEALVGEASVLLEARYKKEGQAWDAAAFRVLRMEDKIEKLRDFLPAFLVEHRAVYGILSKGVHQLSEQECIAAFAPVRGAIDVILDQRLSAQKEEEKVKHATRQIEALKSQMAEGTDKKSKS